MPSGRTHDRITYLSTLPALMATHALLGAWEPALWVAGGLLFGGLMFGPDLDVKSVQYYRWGPLRWIWWPYQRLFRHRSPWTHGLLGGLLVRVVYLGLATTGLGAIAFALMHTYVTPLSVRVEAGVFLMTLQQPSGRYVVWGGWGSGSGARCTPWQTSRRALPSDGSGRVATGADDPFANRPKV